MLYPSFNTHLRKEQLVKNLRTGASNIIIKKLERMAHAVLPGQVAQSASVSQSLPRQSSSTHCCPWDPARIVAAARNRVISNFILGISLWNWGKISDTEWPDGRTLYTVKRFGQLFKAYGAIYRCAHA